MNCAARKPGIAAAIAIIMLALSSCSGKDALNFFVPDTGYHVAYGVAYGSDPRQKMDIYTPDGLTKPACTVLFFYGGRWQTGSRDLYRFAGQAFTAKGCVAAVADYRLYPQIHYPDFLKDGAAAFVFLHRHARDYGGDPGRVFLAGHSAGGYNALMLTLDPRYIRAAGGSEKWIKGVIGISGPYDFLPFTDKDIIDVFGSTNDPSTQPITYVHAGLPPVMLAVGTADTDVKPKNTRNLAAKLRAFHDRVTVHEYQGVYHEAIVLSLLNGFRGHTPLLDDIAAFIRENP